ncbi:hypothetical protein V5O48_017507 [Marasmius crinis-equi]|uniref:Uncharacterized protein n=1 Tax=Marasmius crinis-equi TaxID=585013 RepID=A0ABR3ENR9_9AGAR
MNNGLWQLAGLSGSVLQILELAEVLWNGFLSLNTVHQGIEEPELQAEAHKGLTSNIPGELIDEWENMCTTWEQAPWLKCDIFNPFEVTEEYQSQAECLRELALDNK